MKRSLLLFVAIAVPVAALRIGCQYVEDRPPDESSVPVVDPGYLVLREVVPLGAGRPEPAGAGEIVTGAHGARFAVAGEVIVDLSGMDAGSASLEERGQPPDTVLRIRFTREGGRLFSAWTRDHIGRYVGIFVDGELIEAPVVHDVIDRVMTIPLDRAEAARIRDRLLAGGAPAPREER